MRALLWLTMVGLALCAGCETTRCHVDEEEGDEVKVSLDQVPAAVMAAAEKEVPGIEIEEAATEVEKGVTVYELTGTANGTRYEVEVTADGKVLEVEKGDDGEDHDDDADDDDK